MHISIPGDWASNNLVFAISRGSCTATPSTPPQRSALSRHAVFPSRFRVQVGRVTQRHAPSEPLLPAGAIQRRVRRRNFALRTAFPSPLVRRYSHDYYEACVAIGLAPLRRSRVRPCHTSERDLGAPLISLNALTEHRSAPRKLRRTPLVASTWHGAGFRRLSGGRPLASPGDWDSGSLAFHHIARVPQRLVSFA
jgi:hypothetical protein